MTLLALAGLFPEFCGFDYVLIFFLLVVFSHIVLYPTFVVIFIYVGVWSVTSIYSPEDLGWLSDKFQMLQFWLSCKLSRIANLLHMLRILLGLFPNVVNVKLTLWS